MIDSVPDLSHAPGCFASALMCRPGTAECDSCIFVARCAPLSEVKRATLHEKFGVVAKAPAPKKPRAPKKPKVEKPVMVSPAAQTLVERIEGAGLAVGDSLRQGVNPFNKPAFLKVACHLLLKRPEGLDPELLAAAFIHKLDCDPPRAAAQSVLAIEALTALGAIENHNSRLRVRA